MTNKQRYTFWLIVMLGLWATVMTSAQGNTTDQCPPIITEAISLASASCDDLGRNSACYGHNQVVASFTDESQAEDFAQPADTAQLANIMTISTSALNADESLWGLALMNVQANIPDTIPGQGVLFFLMGETTVENAVSSQPPTIVPTSITVTASQRVNVRSGAGRNFNPLGGADPNSVWTATGVSEDFTWVRITFGNTDGWISRDLITPVDETAFNALPVVTSEIRSPMQAFYFTTGAGNPTCKQAPDALVIQSPERLSVNLSVNGATVRIGSTIVFTTQQGEDDANDDLPDACRRTEAIVLDGALDVNQNRLRIPIGHSAYFTACADDDGNLVPQDDWEAGGIVSQDRLQEFGILETLPDGFLHYPIRIPTQNDIERALRPTPVPTRDTSTPVEVTATPNTSGAIDCSGFVAISPLNTIAWGVQEFRWTALNGVSFFYLTVERTDNLPGSVFISQVGGTAQSMFVDVGVGALYQVGRALNLKWRIEAWALDQNGQAYPACQTAQIPVRRSVPSFADICAQLNGYVSGGTCYRNDTTGTPIVIPD